MPLYEYQCRQCQQAFELLVRTGDVPACPACQSTDLERSISAFGVTTAGTSQANLQKARADYKKGQKDKMIAAREEREHHQH